MSESMPKVSASIPKGNKQGLEDYFGNPLSQEEADRWIKQLPSERYQYETPDPEAPPPTPEAEEPAFVKTRELARNEAIRLESDTLAREPLYADGSEFQTKKSFSGVDVMATIIAGRQKFYLLDLRSSKERVESSADVTQINAAPTIESSISFSNSEGSTTEKYPGDFLLVSEEFFTSGGTSGYKSLKSEPGRTNWIDVGRQHEGFDYDPSVSREHFRVQVGPEDFDHPDQPMLSIQNYTPKNPTIVEYMSRNR